LCGAPKEAKASKATITIAGVYHKNKRIKRTAHGHDLPALFWLSSYVAGHHLAVAPQYSAKDQMYCTAYYITLNSYCEAQRASKNLKNIC
jgi:hypothetical protein